MWTFRPASCEQNLITFSLWRRQNHVTHKNVEDRNFGLEIDFAILLWLGGEWSLLAHLYPPRHGKGQEYGYIKRKNSGHGLSLHNTIATLNSD